jgi:Flp pilus assembly pilin Flp
MRIALNKTRQFGQGMTEYIIIVALIAVAAIAVTQLFGKTIRSQMAAISQEVAGKDGSASAQAAGTAADKAKAEGEKDKSLSTYAGNADAGK